ncbi:MAG: 50S ribosomal protein L5 [Planctomycetes bacterium]|jgi:large subunit ribosomal protein L5|nr:50S ribosomal protein L5 [Planctomycetaceae bacterium]NBV63085.1 50S ribosomal protein L5 [Planctomycetota bacterium]
MAATREIPRLQKSFREEVIPKVLKEFGLKNANQVPKVAKVIVSTGVGKRLENQKLKPEHREAVIDTYRKITGQNPIMIKAKKAVSNFKVREGSPSAFMVTLRRDRMWGFLDRLINLAIPRIKDFRGVSDKSFDRGGSWAMGLTEQAVWPEINMANVNFSHGMHVNIVFENSDPKMSRFVLAELGMPFVRPEENSKKA